MDIRLIEELIEMVGRSPVSEVEFERDGWRVRIAKHAAGRVDAPVLAPPASVREEQAAHGLHDICAPLTGTFFASESEGGAPLVAVGDEVREGQVIAILEAMKMLNPVEADRGGRIRAIAVENGRMVQSGDRLFTLEVTD